MNLEFIHNAKRLIPEIVEQSETLEKGETLIIQETPNGCTLKRVIEQKAFIDESGTVIDQSQTIALGSGPLKAKQIKSILAEFEYLQYI